MKKRTIIWLFPVAIMGIFLLLTDSCKKKESTDPDPVVKDPYAMFEYTKKSNGIVLFENTSENATSYLWDFGDLNTSTTTAKTFEYQYLQNGTYYVLLTAYGNGTSAGAYANLDITSVDGNLPTVETSPITNITQSMATSGGNVTSGGSSTVTARGVCWSTTQNPTVNDTKTINGNGTGSFTSEITGLISNTLYYVRAYATNGIGTGYGNQVSFTTTGSSGPQPCPGIPTVTYGGQTYNTVKIGTQCWFRENLNIGTEINGWNEQRNNGIIEKYCFGDLASNCDIYGGMYSWDEMMQYTSIEGAQGICPIGWHIPTIGEWTTLRDFLGGENVAGGKLKETGFEHWDSPNTGATNSSGFTALPGGTHWGDGTWVSAFADKGTVGFFVVSSFSQADKAWIVMLVHEEEGIAFAPGGNLDPFTGYSVRCIKD